jgi:predicted MPP superfamily phosphohydrolase
MNRRSFIKGIAVLGGAGLLTGVYSWQIEPFWLEFVKVKMSIKNLPDHLIGKTIMQISDMHIGNRFDRQFIIDSFLEAKIYKPDFVVYTGDFISYESDEQFDQLKEVFNNSVYGKIGTVGILGNHDYGRNWSQNHVAEIVVKTLTEKGIPILRNEQLNINGLNFIGLDDYWATNFHPTIVMNELSGEQANIVLCHNPDVADEPVWNNYKGWILSGHTHGGQVKPPFLDPPVLPVKNKNYSAGKYDLADGRTLYINRALGNLWQVRFNVRPEITIFELETS